MKNLRTILMASVVMIVAMSCNSQNYSQQKESKPKYIFLFIGDGMGLDQVAVTESYLSYKAGKLGGEQLSFTRFPNLALCTTHSNNRHVTCSASSATAIATGVKTDARKIGVDPEGNRLRSVAYDLHEDGYNVGILTTVPVNHATPAGFFACADDRNDYYEISSQIPESGFEFFGGSGFYHYKGKDGDMTPTDEMIREKGYTVCYGTEEYKACADTASHIVFCQESTRGQDPEYYVSDGAEAADITLAQMLQLSLDFMGDEKPFFIMCEGGTIDWSCHANKTMSMVYDVLEFDEAVQKGLEFYEKHPDETLIIVTADHETGGITIGRGEDWRPEIVEWEMLESIWKEDGCKNTRSYEENCEINEKAYIGWTSCHHTGSPVPVYSIGKGAEKFNGRIDNTDIRGKILGE